MLQDMKELDELSAAALQAPEGFALYESARKLTKRARLGTFPWCFFVRTWEEAAEAARNGNCEGTFEVLKSL